MFSLTKKQIMEDLYITAVETSVEDVLYTFKKNSKEEYKSKKPSYECFKKIIKHYMLCALSPEYMDYVDKNESDIKQTVKTFNITRCNVVTEIINKAKFENIKMFNILSWVYSAKKIVMIEAHKADTHYCYVTSEKIEEAYIPVLLVYTEESKNPRVVSVCSQYKFFIFSFYTYIHIEHDMQVKGREWLRSQAWYYKEGVSKQKKIKTLMEHNNEYFSKLFFVRFNSAVQHLI